MFVIAPTDVAVQVRAAHAPVLRFATSAEFERWSHESASRVAAAVHAALDELQIDLAACSPRTQEVIAHLCDRETIPSVKELFAACSSRRSFYRSWNKDIKETPAAFLTRVRLLHLRFSAARDLQAAQRGTSGDSRVMP
ncbi:MAG TPA: hypothetical protein VF911_17870 [Thermoanaerobaculia bacterium]